jgi:hypothetical protein
MFFFQPIVGIVNFVEFSLQKSYITNKTITLNEWFEYGLTLKSTMNGIYMIASKMTLVLDYKLANGTIQKAARTALASFFFVKEKCNDLR